MTLLGAVELGGTKIRVARGTADGTILDSATFPTTGPAESFERVRAYFQSGMSVRAIGMGSFGPVVVRGRDLSRGEMRATPKPGWSGFNVVQALAPMGVPIGLETDVAAAGLGEHRCGALRGLDCGLYLTVGTGIGGALILDGKVVNGAGHAEMGHILLNRAPGDDVPSSCPYHAHCAEGLASGPAIRRRFGYELSSLKASQANCGLIGDYLGQLVAALVLTLAPQRIVVGGGVAKTPGLLATAHGRMIHHLNGYGSYPELSDPGFLAPPALADDAGLTGALILASGQR